MINIKNYKNLLKGQLIRTFYDKQLIISGKGIGDWDSGLNTLYNLNALWKIRKINLPACLHTSIMAILIHIQNSKRAVLSIASLDRCKTRK